MTDFFQKDILEGRRVLVTGGGSGICQGIALAFAQHGANVAVMGRKIAPLEETAQQMSRWGGKTLAVSGDVRETEQVEAAIKQVTETFGGLDVLVNGAAGNFLCPTADLSYKGFRTVVEIDLLGTFNMTHASFPHLKASPHASILNISATLHYGGTPMQSHVSAAKAGVDALTRHLAVEWGPLGIRVNAIAPGPIEATEGAKRLIPDNIRESMRLSTPLQRFGTIADISQAAVFITSDAAAYMHGAIVVIDGGRWLNNMSLHM